MGTEREVRIRMADGVDLAATLFLPDDALGPQPCLLEALPYRKDDLTSSYASSYRSLRDRHRYAVCRLDLRGTGSSGGDATDEYPAAEQRDLVEAIAWLAEQPWCDGSVGMWGTSYSGFNSLQLACERPPALKAVCAIYASDDRWTDDVHWRGGALRLVDLVDYCHYMTPMNALPPVPALWGEGWREEWLRRVDTLQPWVLTWLREDRDGDYWRHGSVRRPGDTGYERIACPVMLVAGWADGYRNNSFRTVSALRAAGVPARLLAGPWAHADATTAMPGPRIDLETELVTWFDHWLRGRQPADGRGSVDVDDVFVRTSTPPAPDLDLHAGYWVRDVWTSEVEAPERRPLPGFPRTLEVRPDVGTAAWIDCAGHLPWGLSDDQRHDDADSLIVDLPAPADAFVGHPRVRLRVSASAPDASVSVKLCDVFPDGTSALICRGSLDLRFRDGVHGQPQPLHPDEEYDVTLDLDACAYRLDPGHRLRVAVAGADWPNTVAPPRPVRLTVHAAELELPTYRQARAPEPPLRSGAATSAEDPEGVTWSVTRDVLRRTTRCTVGSVSGYDTPHEGHAVEDYAGEVAVDLATFGQRADAACTFELAWPQTGTVRVHSTMTVLVEADARRVDIDLEASLDGEVLRRRSWRERFPRAVPASGRGR